MFLPLLRLPNTKVVCADQTSHEQKRGEFHSKEIGLIEGDSDLLWTHGAPSQAGAAAVPQKIDDFGDQYHCQDGRAGPHPGTKPLALEIDGSVPEVEHHDHKDEEHHDRASIDDDFQSSDEGGAKDIEDYCYGEERDNEVE